jgi:hypothetical protein
MIDICAGLFLLPFLIAAMGISFLLREAREAFQC